MSDELARRLKQLEEHAARLERTQRQLEEDLQDLDHHARRLADRRERGETSATLDGEQRRIDESRAQNRQEQGVNACDLETLRRERQELERRIEQMRTRHH